MYFIGRYSVIVYVHILVHKFNLKISSHRISSEYESGPSRGERATWERGGDRYAQSPSRGHRSSEHYWDYHHHDSSGHSYESRKNDGFTGK